MIRQLFASFGVAVAVVLLVAGSAGATDTQDSQRQEIEAKLTDVFNAYLSEFKTDLKNIKAKNAAKGDKLIAACAIPESHGAFADPHASGAQKLAEIDDAASGFRTTMESKGGNEAFRAGLMVLTCRAVAAASGHYWAGAVFAKVFSQINHHDGEDLLAAYYGSGILGVTDFARAKQALEEAKEPKAENPQAIVALIDAYDSKAASNGGAAPASPADKVKIEAGFKDDLDALVFQAQSLARLQVNQAEDQGFGGALDLVDNDCPKESGFGPAFSSSNSTPTVKLEAIESAASMVGGKYKPELLSRCLLVSLAEKSFWTALVLSVAQADQGADAASDAGTLYASGAVGPPDYHKARYYFKKALAQTENETAAAPLRKKIAAIDALAPGGAAPSGAASSASEPPARHVAPVALNKALDAEFQSVLRVVAFPQSRLSDWSACTPAKDLDPAFASEKVSVEDKLAAVPKAAAAAFAAIKPKAFQSHVHLATQHCGEQYLIRDQAWDALIYWLATAQDKNNTASAWAARVLAAIYGSGQLGVRDYGAAAQWLKQAGDKFAHLRRLVERQVAAGGAIVPVDASALRETDIAADETKIAAMFKYMKDDAIKESKAFGKKFKAFFDREKDYKDALAAFPKVGEDDPKFKVGEVSDEVTFAEAGLMASAILKKAEREKFDTDYVEFFMDEGKPEYNFLLVCGQVLFAQEKYWGALICNQAYANAPVSENLAPALYGVSTLYGSGLLGPRDYGFARTYLKKLRPLQKNGVEALMTSDLIVVIDHLDAAGGPMLIAAESGGPTPKTPE